MEIPIQLKFFKKIELYQDYKFENKKALSTRLQDWKIETIILKWARENHHHLWDPLNEQRIKYKILNGVYEYEYKHAMDSLVQRGYAEHLLGVAPEINIRITKEGLLMGEVIFDVENGGWSGHKYELFYWVVWLTLWSGVIIVFASALKIVWAVIKWFLC